MELNEKFEVWYDGRTARNIHRSRTHKQRKEIGITENLILPEEFDSQKTVWYASKEEGMPKCM